MLKYIILVGNLNEMQINKDDVYIKKIKNKKIKEDGEKYFK